MKIQGAFEQKINFVDGEDYNATVTIKLTYNNPQYSEIKVPVQIKNLPTGKGGIRLYVYRDTDNSLIVQSFVETIEDHNVIYYDLIPVEDGKVTKAFQFTATDKERNKFLDDLANASEEEEETTTAEKAANSNRKIQTPIIQTRVIRKGMQKDLKAKMSLIRLITSLIN